MKHKYNIGQLVELDNGVRLFICHQHDIEPDGDILYALGLEPRGFIVFQASEERLSLVHKSTYRETL